jgi:hypothetical protein
MPNVTFHIQTMQAQLGLVQTTLVELDTVAQSTLNQSQLFLSVSEKLTQDFVALHLDEPNVMQTVFHVLAFLNPVFTVCAVIGFVYMYIRLRTLTAALTLLTGMRGASAMLANSTTSTTTQRIWRPKAWLTPTTTIAPSMPEITVAPFQFNPFTLANWRELEFEDNSFKKIHVHNAYFHCCTFVAGLLRTLSSRMFTMLPHNPM